MAGFATSSVDLSGPGVIGSFLKMPAATPARSVQALEQPIELIQSLDLVQTTVCATMSTVAFLRRIFPDDCYRTHEYDIEDPNYSYKDFMNTTDKASAMSVSKPNRVDHRFIPWQILVRGRNSGANKLLDWIELGMADALSHKYLATMQLSIYDGEVSLDKRLEAYIMVFSYTEARAEMTIQLSGAKGLPSPPVNTISSTKQDLRYLVHRLSNHVGGFPALSPHSIVNMHLTYNDTCPASYEPLGFVPCQDQALVLESNEGAAVGSIHPGPHSVNLRVFLKENIPGPPTSMATLRGPANGLRSVNSIFPYVSNSAATQELQASSREQILINSPLTEELDQKLSQLSNTTNELDTQERGQLAAIDSMARLRFPQHDPHDTQILDGIVSTGDTSRGSVDLDGESTVNEGSSTQGTPSTAGGRRSARLAIRSNTNSPPKALSMLRPRKRQATPAEPTFAKLRKISEARSPFIRQRSKK